MTTNREYPEIISGEELAALKARAELVEELVYALSDAACSLRYYSQLEPCEREILKMRRDADSAERALARAKEVMKDES